MRRRTAVMFFLIALLAVGAYWIDFGFGKPASINLGGYKNDLTLKQGLDLQGGIQLVMQANCPQDRPKCDVAGSMPEVIDNVNRRIAGGLAVNDAVVRQQGSNRVSIEIPGLKDEAQARALLGSTGQMYVIDTGSQQLNVGTDVTGQTCTTTCQSGQYKILFRGDELNTSAISAGLDQNTGAPIVTFAFSDKDNAKTRFGDYTKAHVGQFLTIILDNKVIESATIQSEIYGNGQITGLQSTQDAQNLASILRYGALPLPLSVVSERQLAPTLGQQALNESKIAAGVGLGLVVLFMLIYYRLPGLLADVALILYAAMLFAIIKLLGVTLSLPGIAATVLTIGMAVDANVLIFERIKEELRSGRTMAAAIDIGFKRAWPSIRDSNASTLITCAILYFFGNNFGATLIVGFAINLAIGVALSLFTAITVTRNLLNILLLFGVAQHPAWYGLPRNAINLPRYTRPVSRLSGAGTGGGRTVIAPKGAPSATEAEAADESGELEPVGNVSNGRTPSAASANTAGSTGGVEE